MTKMTPEQQAAHAPDHGFARSDLPEDAQRAYDRLAEQRTRAATPPPPGPASGHIAGYEAGRRVPGWLPRLPRRTLQASTKPAGRAACESRRTS
jgi:hypothetical protein